MGDNHCIVNMKVLALICLFGIAIASPIDSSEPEPEQLVNWDDCEWVWGDAKTFKNCKDGYVGVGACGNKGQQRCNNKAFGIHCCKMNGGAKSSCTRHDGKKGQRIDCPSNTAVFGTCGSLDSSRCDYSGNRYCVTIECCNSSLKVSESGCNWTYGSNQGDQLYCSQSGNMVLAGRCGSETMAQCDGSKVHGIKCCPASR